MWAKSLNSTLGYKDDWSKCETVYLEHGMEFNEKSKGVNVFLKEKKSWDKLAEKAEMFQSFKGKLYSLDIDCPDYGKKLKSRVRSHSSDRFKNLNFDRISKICSTAKTIRHKDLNMKGLVLGDSHALSAWREDAYLCRNDGQTLNGALTTGFDTWLEQYGNINFLRTYFGNIDVRHHVCRLETSSKNQHRLVDDLVLKYIGELKRCQQKYSIKELEVVELLPIENINRKLPKTGYYKDRPYWGSWKERNEIYLYFNEFLTELCTLNNIKVIRWPEKFINAAGELGFEFMEKPRSVHISPQHYMWEIK